MRTTPIGIAMLNDEREHVYTQNNKENMAVVQTWADFIQKSVKNVDSSAPAVVLGSEIIVGTRSAQKVGEELSRANCKQVIMLYNVWNFPFLCWPFINSLGDVPILSLSNNNGQYPGNVGLLATDGALRQAGKRTHRIVGDLKDKETQRRVLAWIRASQAATTIQNEVFGCYGGHSMGMETGFAHLTPTLKSLGCTVRQIDQLWLVKEAEKVDKKEIEKGRLWFEKLLGKRLKYDGRMLTPETLERQIGLYLAMQHVNEDKGFDFCGLKGQRELTEHYCLGDVPEMLMNDPYDWRGPKESVVCSTEADAYAAITMQLMKYITGGMPALFMDVRLYHPKLDLWDWCNSGNHSSWFAAQSMKPEENFKTITFHPALEFYFKAGGASVEFDAAPGPMTFARLGLWDEKPYMVIVRGESKKLPAAERKKLNDMTNPTWPHVHAQLECDFEEFLSVFPCNHVLGAAGDIVQPLVYLCEIRGIKPIVLGKTKDGFYPPIWELMR
ncbi:MAG: fucose isomerase [Candidatus Omnitrophota bacterium]